MCPEAGASEARSWALGMASSGCWLGIHAVDPVVVGGGVVGSVVEDGLVEGDGFDGAGFGLAFVVEAFAEGVGEEDAGLQVGWVVLDGLTPDFCFFQVFAGFVFVSVFGVAGLGGFDIELLLFGGVFLEGECVVEGGFCVGVALAAAEP